MPSARSELIGQSVSRGEALGRARVRALHTPEITYKRINAAAVTTELQRLHTALTAAREEMRNLRKRLQGAMAEEAGEFIELHALLLDDPELLHSLDSLISEELYSADFALRVQRDRLVNVFERMEDPYLKSRLNDLDHVIGRIFAYLHQQDISPQNTAGEILISDSVAASELAQLQAEGIIAIVTADGSMLSHSAILARSLRLPLVVGVTGAVQRIKDGDVLIVDADSGLIIVNPAPADLRNHRQRLKETVRERRELERLRNKPTRTRDGTDITLHANAESDPDIARARTLGASGIGLFRTEFLFLQRDALPSEDEQFERYRDVVLSMSGRSVTIRVLDMGADKVGRTDFNPMPEKNPALGLRGIRLLMARPKIFDTQLRAIVRAAAYGYVRILIPMVNRREELVSVRRRLRRVIEQLRAQGHEVPEHIPLGTMIEVPAAALSIHNLIDLVDFISIGTNDLVQYMLATDRCNEALEDIYSPLHPGILHLLQYVIAAGAEHSTSVAICGEIAGDPLMTRLLLALGLTEFSLHVGNLLEVRKIIRDSDLFKLRAATEKLLKMRDRAGIQRWLSAINAES